MKIWSTCFRTLQNFDQKSSAWQSLCCKITAIFRQFVTIWIDK